MLTPLLILLALFAVACGRAVDTSLRLSDAAHSAARAASLARDPTTAARAADTAAHAALPAGSTCTQIDVTVDTSAFAPGGSVTVRVSCQIDIVDLGGFVIPGGPSQTTSFTSPIDTFRGLNP